MGRTVDELLCITDRRLRLIQRPTGFFYFCAYYFPHYFKMPSADFHVEMCDLIADPFIAVLILIAFRESAKTAFARMFVIYCIVLRRKRNIAWVGHDLKKARKNLLGVSNELQSNRRLIRDFGQLYYEEERKEKKSKPKQVEEFVTENGVMVRATSVNISTRGDLFGAHRPDLYILDDLENNEVKASPALREKTIEFLEELFSGISVDAQIISLNNRISKNGVTAWLEMRAKQNPTEYRVYEKKLVENGKTTWPGAWVMTDREAYEHNRRRFDRKKWVRSVESDKRKLGTKTWLQEKQNVPANEGGKIVKREWFKRYSRERLVQDAKGNFWYTFDGDSVSTCGVVYTAIDPAISAKETSDERAMQSGIVFERLIKTEYGDEQRIRYYLILPTVAGRWSLKEFGEEVIKQRDAVRPREIGVENNGVQEVFRQSFQLFGISTVPLNPDTDKARRLNQHTGDIEFGSVLFPDDGSTEGLEDELVDFTGASGGKDNRVDAFSYVMQMMKRTKKKFRGNLIG